MKILDGAAVVYYLETKGIVTFDEYADQVFVPHIKKQLENSRRVDIVWDTYVIPNSIKESTREKQGKGVRRRLQATTSSHKTGQISYVIQPTNRSCSHSFLTRLPLWTS